MSKLLDAYFTLGVAPDSPLSDVQDRYKWLASVYHPDRFSTAKKDKAEVEMKRVNDARDVIKEHFALSHPNQGAHCNCFKIDPGSNATSNNPEPARSGAAGNSQSSPKQEERESASHNQEQCTGSTSGGSDSRTSFGNQSQGGSFNNAEWTYRYADGSEQTAPQPGPVIKPSTPGENRTNLGWWIFGIISWFLMLKFGSAW
ncbi:MAG TPA: J domain-containing protein [Planktothrix sp.]|jgi:curved DNA-binding protein CbpA